VVVWNVVARPSDYASLPSSLDEHEELIGIVLTIMPCIGYNGCIRLDLENALIVIQNLVRGSCDCRSRVRTELWLLVALHVHGRLWSIRIALFREYIYRDCQGTCAP